jgi:hypothetical protein
MSYSVCTEGGAKTPSSYRLRKSFCVLRPVSQRQNQVFLPRHKDYSKTARIVRGPSPDRSAHRCACAGLSVAGITRDVVLFQPTVTSLAIPLAEFTNAGRAIALIKAKLAEGGAMNAVGTGSGVRDWLRACDRRRVTWVGFSCRVGEDSDYQNH